MQDHFVVVITTAPRLSDGTRKLASGLAARANAVLLFLHVVPLRSTDGEAMLLSATRLAAGEDRAWLLGLKPTDPSVRFRHRLESGEPEQVVARFVAENSVDLVVVEEPHRSRASVALWRGFGEHLIRELDCPVVIGGPKFLGVNASLPGQPGRPGRLAARCQEELSTLEKLDLLSGLLDARVDSLRLWMAQVAEAAKEAVSSDIVASLSATGESDGPGFRRMVRRLRVELDERARALQAVCWQLECDAGCWGSFPSQLPPSRALTSFLDRVRAEGSSTSLPLALDPGGDRLVVLAAATVSRGNTTLVFAFDAATDFLRILGQPGPLRSFETYAFDETGLMLSNSRFIDHLLRAGLLPKDAGVGMQTPLRLRVAEPSEGPAESWPLTRMARQAVQHRDGFDTRGYPDYRGTQVIGAWRWVDDYGFGVSAEVDQLPPTE